MIKPNSPTSMVRKVRIYMVVSSQGGNRFLLWLCFSTKLYG
jgi:hypothetical protein